MERYLRKNNIPVSKKLELTSNEAVKQAVIAGLGCSVMPLIGLRNEIKDGDLKIIPVNDLPIVTTWNLIYLKNKRFSPVAEAFLEHIHLEKENIIKQYFNWFEGVH